MVSDCAQRNVYVPDAPAGRVLYLPPARTARVTVGAAIAQKRLDLAHALLHAVIRLALQLRLQQRPALQPVLNSRPQHTRHAHAAFKPAHVEALQQQLAQRLRYSSRG
jgi:hypothetical protein